MHRSENCFVKCVIAADVSLVICCYISNHLPSTVNVCICSIRRQTLLCRECFPTYLSMSFFFFQTLLICLLKFNCVPNIPQIRKAQCRLILKLSSDIIFTATTTKKLKIYLYYFHCLQWYSMRSTIIKIPECIFRKRQCFKFLELTCIVCSPYVFIK